MFFKAVSSQVNELQPLSSLDYGFELEIGFDLNEVSDYRNFYTFNKITLMSQDSFGFLSFDRLRQVFNDLQNYKPLVSSEKLTFDPKLFEIIDEILLRNGFQNNLSLFTIKYYAKFTNGQDAVQVLNQVYKEILNLKREWGFMESFPI